MLASIICFYSLKYVANDSSINIKTLIYIFVASLFHYSAILFILIFIINRIKLKRYFFIFIVMCATILCCGSELLIDFAKLTKYAVYFGDVYEPKVGVFICIVFLSFAFCLRYDSINDLKDRTYFSALTLMVIFSLISIIIPILTRVVMLFSPALVVCVTNAAFAINKKRFRMLILGMMILLFFIYSNYTCIINGSNGVYPYRSIFGVD